jgi:hypothetical protein
VNAFNRGMGRADLERLVSQFNASHALTNDTQGRTIPRIMLPAGYAFGDNSHSLNLRLSRSFVFRERLRLSLIGEVFNLYNKANLTGYRRRTWPASMVGVSVLPAVSSPPKAEPNTIDVSQSTSEAGCRERPASSQQSNPAMQPIIV